MSKQVKITTEEYKKLDDAYHFFNEKLFGEELPQVLITLNHNQANNLGYYSPRGFFKREEISEEEKAENSMALPGFFDRDHVGEISLNPDAMSRRTDKEILSTLVHEMCHVWQHNFGRPTRNGYHNKEWGRKMKDVGLHPSNTGAEGGSETGQQMTHYIMEAGPFEKFCKELQNGGWKLDFQSAPGIKGTVKKSKFKYECPQCGQAAWAKPNAKLICGECEVKMECEEEEEN